MMNAQHVAEDGFPYIAFAFSLLVPAIFAWGTLEAIKRTLLNRWKMTKPPEELLKLGTESAMFRSFEISERGWWIPLMWFLAVVLGFGCGAFVGSIGWDWEWGALTGVAGGALSSFFVALFKRQAASAADAVVGKVLEKFGAAGSKPEDGGGV